MNINWDAKGYKENFSFVHEYGEDVVSLLKSTTRTPRAVCRKLTAR